MPPARSAVLIVCSGRWASHGGASASSAPGLALALLAIVLLQGALGMLTVTWQLKPLIVSLHLLFGFDHAVAAVVAGADAAVRARRREARSRRATRRRRAR